MFRNLMKVAAVVSLSFASVYSAHAEPCVSAAMRSSWFGGGDFSAEDAQTLCQGVMTEAPFRCYKTATASVVGLGLDHTTSISLCAGTRAARNNDPASCYSTATTTTYLGGLGMSASLAHGFCAGIYNANAIVSCYKNAVTSTWLGGSGLSEQEAYDLCRSQAVAARH